MLLSILRQMARDTGFAARWIWLLFFMLLGSMLLAGLAEGLILITGEVFDGFSLLLRQTLVSLGLFFLSALLFAFLFFDPPSFWGSREMPEGVSLLAGLTGLILLFPLISYSAAWNQAVHFPAFLESFQDWLARQESEMQELLESFVVGQSLLMALIIVVAVPSLSEEFFFRGVLQRLIAERWQKPHLAIWATALIFGLFHLQFLSLLPRVFLGAWLGYLYYWTRNIWIPVVVHFLNNATGVFLLRYFEQNKLVQEQHWTSQLPPLWLLVLCLLLVVLVGRGLVRREKGKL